MSRKPIKTAINMMDQRISQLGDGKYARGLASEGYLGGYRDALCDVLLLLGKIEPCIRPEYRRE